MNVLGLDIGGANLKAAHSSGSALSVPFPLWKEPSQLSHRLRELIAATPAHGVVAVTMTGELCDCFGSKSEGVLSILDAVSASADGRPVRVWTLQGFVNETVARQRPLTAASANWLALAAYACRHVQANGLLIDIGSTTTDIVPMASGRPAPKGAADAERLRSLELVYTGVRRTPICAVLGVGVAAELFATTLDAYLVLEIIAENTADRNTADGRPATKAAAHARLARMLCADPEALDRRETTKLAQRILLRQVYQLTMALDHVLRSLPGSADTVVISGEGEFLARLVLNQQNGFRGGRVISLADKLGPEISRAACAYALAVLAQESH
jgi:probable H4MPT-linked C1 transfer pathway protein